MPLVLFYSWYSHYAFHGKQASGAEPRTAEHPASITPSQEASSAVDSEHRPPRRTRRILVKALQIIAGTVSGIVLYFFCERMFAGYPQYGTEIITYVGLAVIMATGGYAWIMDHRRLDADEPDADE